MYMELTVYMSKKKRRSKFRIDLQIELRENILNFDNYKSESFDNSVN